MLAVGCLLTVSAMGYLVTERRESSMITNAVMVVSSTSRAVHLGPASSTDVISSKAHITEA